MLVDSIKFKGHRCFKNDWAGFDTIKPLNVIIGRNNTGKFHLLDLVEAICNGKLAGRGWKFSFSGTLDEASLQVQFRPGTSGGLLGGDFWLKHGQHFLGERVEWQADDQLNPSEEFRYPSEINVRAPGDVQTETERLNRIRGVLKDVKHQLSNTIFKRLLADRDIDPETPGMHLALGPDGHGATNIIRRYIHTSHPNYPRELVQRDCQRTVKTSQGGSNENEPL